MAYSDMAHIPTTLREPTLTLGVESAWTGNLPTFCFGIVDHNYTEVAWKTDKQNVLTLFGVSDPAFIFDVKGHGVGGRQIDGHRLADETTRAIQIINESNSRKMRIVSLGRVSNVSMFEAKESLVRGWQIQANEKQLQYLSSGDSKHCANLNFCKALCMKQLCKRIQFYNTMDYNQYGYYKSEMPFDKLARLQIGLNPSDTNLLCHSQYT